VFLSLSSRGVRWEKRVPGAILTEGRNGGNAGPDHAISQNFLHDTALLTKKHPTGGQKRPTESAHFLWRKVRDKSQLGTRGAKNTSLSPYRKGLTNGP